MGAKRGQSSVEYLMTYGWAFIILLAVLAILYSFGVFNPQQYMGEECLFQPSLQCKSMTLMSNDAPKPATPGEFKLTLNNGLGYPIAGTTYCEAQLLSTGSNCTSLNGCCALQGPIGPNEAISITAKFPSGTLRSATLEKVKITITYKIPGSDEEYTTSGMVAVRVS